MKDTEIKAICNANICTHRFNYMNAAKEIVANDRNSEETKSIFAAYLRENEQYGEGRLSGKVYQWARNYEGPLADEYAYRNLWHVHAEHMRYMLEAYIDLVDRTCA